MPRWIHRLFSSRRAGIGLASATGLMVLGSCGGLMLASFTVAGMDTEFYASPQGVASIEPSWTDRTAEMLPDPVVAYAPDGRNDFVVGK